MFERVDEARFIEGEHHVLRWWDERSIFAKLLAKNVGGPKWSFLDGPITANNPMGVHHAWGRTYKDAYQRYRAMRGHELRYQNGFDCQGLWVEVEVEKEMGLGTKTAIAEHGIDKFVRACKQRVLTFAARQTEQSIRLGYWMQWDDPGELRKLADHIDDDQSVTLATPKGETASGTAEELTARLGNPEWGGSYFTFSTENNETIWTFLKKCFERKKIYLGHDVMPWGGRAGSAYSQMEVADGRRLTTHRSCFVRFPIIEEKDGTTQARRHGEKQLNEYLLVWTTTPWTLTSNVAAAVNPDLEYVRVKAQIRGDEEPAYYYFAKENLEYKRLEREYKEGFGRPEWGWPDGLGKLKTIAQIFKEQGGYEVEGTLKGADMVGWRYAGPFDDLEAQAEPLGQTQQDRFDHRQNWAANVIDPVFQRVADESDRDLALIRESSPDEKTDAHLALLGSWGRFHTHGSNNRKNFFLSVDVLLENMGLHGWFKIDVWNDREASSKILTTLKDFGVSREVCRRIESYVEELDGDLRNQDSEAAIVLLEDFIREQPNLIRLIHEDLLRIRSRTAIANHRVITGGVDSKGNQHVVAGEGTGIVHIAPGCGDVDHTIGERVFLNSIAPLKEDGTFGEGFGPFTGREAIDPATADLVFDELRRKGLLVYVEEYPHVYPHCWRTGEELVFRLVDEWFINMDWRDEIKEVTRAINWLPPSINGQEREVEWLSTMRDWMISKKRFWGLALPIWVNPDDASDFKVVGSLAELKDLATNGGEGWEQFEGHTPHRPWIDAVRIPSDRHPGQLLRRVEDVGNPWLDAGITPFSTMGYREQPELWQQWYPADFVTECFPGQFRNWFYSLLALSTMMRYDETDNPEDKRPFKCLLGHRLVMDEQGQPMHKSDGTAIWFEEAAEQLGVDTLRWMYLAQNPAADLRFGTRHPDEPVTLDTPQGPISETREGLPTVRVTSKPADEIRRQVLIPLWNSYAFFVNYAVADEFDPSLNPVRLADRPEIDRWILSRLQELIAVARSAFESYDVANFMTAAATYIDDLSNWYIRRNRRRFWRSRGEASVQSPASSDESRNTGHSSPDAGPAWDADKLAAYQTLHEVLLTLTKLLAPCVPFVTERMYQNLAVRGGGAWASGGRPPTDEGRSQSADNSSTPPQGANGPRSPESVHLCDYPAADGSKLDLALNRKTSTVQTLVRLAHRLRESAELRVRQPLAELRFATSDAEQAAALEESADIIADELNVKQVMRAANLDDLVSYSFKPNLKTLGPKYGKLLGSIRSQLPQMDGAVLAPLRNGESVTLTIAGDELTLEPGDVLVSTEQASEWASGDEGGIQVALSTALTPELIREGMARDFVRHVQQARKDAGLDITDRITLQYASDSPEAVASINGWTDYIRAETLADSITRADEAAALARQVTIGEARVSLGVERA